MSSLDFHFVINALLGLFVGAIVSLARPAAARSDRKFGRWPAAKQDFTLDPSCASGLGPSVAAPVGAASTGGETLARRHIMP